jgi:protein-arginine kinase
MGNSCSGKNNDKAVVETQSPTDKSTPVETDCNTTSNPTNTMADDLKRIAGIKTSNPGNIAMACFDEAYFNGLSDADKARLMKIVKSGLENPDSEMGCYAMNPTDYDDFYPFFKNALSKYHKVNLDETKHVNCWDLKTCDGLPADGSLDVSKFGLSALSMRIRTARNLKKFPLAGAMTQQDRCDMENAMQPVFEELIKNPEFGGEYVSLTPGHKCFIDEARYNELVKAHIMFKDMSADSFLMDAGIACHWPHGRGCYFSTDKGFIIWVGEEDHLRIMAMKKSVKINDVFDRLKAAIDVVEKLIPGGCAKSNDFGVITSCPTNMGTGMRASVHVQLPKLTKDGTDTKAKEICQPFGLGVRGLGGEHTPIGADGTVDISPKARFCISEAQIACALYKGVEKVWGAEQNA